MVRKCEGVDTDSNNRPLKEIKIVESGVIPLLKPFIVAKEAATLKAELNPYLAGDVLYPEDIDGNEYIDGDFDDDEDFVGEAKEL